MKKGKTINEIEKTSIIHQTLSNSLHLSWGLDHYPNYLYRQQINDILEYEELLNKQLLKIQQQKNEISYLLNISFNFIQNSSSRSSSKITLDTLCHDILNQQIIEALNLSSNITIGSLLETSCTSTMKYNIAEILEQEFDGIFSLPVFSESFCDEILIRHEQFSQYIQNLLNQENDQDVSQIALLKLSKRSFTFSHMGLELVDQILLWITNTVSSIISPELLKNQLDWVHGYIVKYSSEHKSDSQTNDNSNKSTEHLLGAIRSGLSTHTDDSEITANICLISGEQYSGGELIFSGMRNPSQFNQKTNNSNQQPSSTFSIKLNERGRCVFHSGRQFHEVRSISSGLRMNAIFWFRSKSYRASLCPCCLTNNRINPNENCICGKYWN